MVGGAEAVDGASAAGGVCSLHEQEQHSTNNIPSM